MPIFCSPYCTGTLQTSANSTEFFSWNRYNAIQYNFICVCCLHRNKKNNEAIYKEHKEFFKNYKITNAISGELKAVNVNIFLAFNQIGNYKLLKYWSCLRPLLGHTEVKCSEMVYEDKIMKRFQNYSDKFLGYKKLWKRIQ